MAELNWSGKYAVGVDAIDDDHKELFEAVRGLESAMARFAEPAEMGVLLKKLSAATARHFADEEAMMREQSIRALRYMLRTTRGSWRRCRRSPLATARTVPQ